MSIFEHYDEEQGAMIAWLQHRSPDVWHAVAENLNWDFATDVIEWIVSQPQCDLATAALVFWGTNPEYWLQFPNVGAVPNFQIDNFNFCKTLVDRANSGFYTRRELAFAGDKSCMFDGLDYHLKSDAESFRCRFQEGPAGSFPWKFPALLMPPVPGRAPIVSPEENPETGIAVRNLLADLGTYIGGEQALFTEENPGTGVRNLFVELETKIGAEPARPRPQEFQIGDRVKNNDQEPGTILKINDGDFKYLYLVRLDNEREDVFSVWQLTKIS